MIVTIDGPAGSGKSTAARGLARRLGFCFLDTGAMYRTVGLTCLRRNEDVGDELAAVKIAERVSITFSGDSVFADACDVTAAIRTSEAAEAASVVAMHAGVRHALVNQQRKIADGTSVVTEGRDQGTVAFPHAECKFYLTADLRQRAIRRQIDLKQQIADADLEDVASQIRERDERDENRAVSPLKPAPDAILVDTTLLNPTEVLDRLENLVRQRMEQDGG